MVTQNGRQTTDLKARLLDEGPRFTFIQAVRLLQRLIRRESQITAGEANIILSLLIRPQLSLDFPKTDVVSIEASSRQPEKFTLTASFLGLYGTSSPLPTFYTEDLLGEYAEGYSITRDFLDCLNSTIYHHFYQSWKKYRLAFNLFEETNPGVVYRLFCLLGAGQDDPSLSDSAAGGLLRYIGLTTQSTRSAEGLRTLLADSLNEPSIEIVQLIPRRAEIPDDQRLRLGLSYHHLGQDTYLGSEIQDCMGKFTIHLGPLTRSRFHSFFPDKPACQKLQDLTRFYLNQPLLWDTVIEIKPHDVQTLHLGENLWSHLGWDTWTFSLGCDPKSTEVIL